jgi:hypothetical protein
MDFVDSLLTAPKKKEKVKMPKLQKESSKDA